LRLCVDSERRQFRPLSAFGFRISDFLRISDFGFRLSARALLPVVALAIAAGCSKSPAGKPAATRDPAVPITVAAVEIVPLDRTLPVVGTLYAKDEATIGAQVEGQVERTLVDFGDRVKAGQDLALIDTASYEALSRQSDANIARAKASALNAEQNLKRAQDLSRNNIASAADLDLAIAQAEQARAEVKAAEAASAIAQLNLSRSHVRAAFDGAVAERVASAGDFVKIGAPLFKLVNDDTLKLVVQAPERYAAAVKMDQPLLFTVDAWPGETFEGRIYLINPAVSAASRSFNLAARVANPDRKLKANTFARGELILERAVPTAVVPLEAVVNFAGITKTFVLSNNAVQPRAITIGRVHGGRQEVISGLSAGEQVVVSGQSKLFAGAPVRLKQPDAPAVKP
jgi:membrane fusion protein (multidrug efflux system)